MTRLQNAKDDTQRSLDILNFIAQRNDKDPLLNSKLNTYWDNNNNNKNNNNNHIQLQQNDSSHSSHHSYQSDDDINNLSPNLEYLPSNTEIRLSNKSIKKICDLQIGDKILSLCINLYPNGKSRNSYLPKPNKKNLSALKKKEIKKKSLSGLPKRPRSRTTANIKPTFMLPPPQSPSNNNIEIDI